MNASAVQPSKRLDELTVAEPYRAISTLAIISFLLGSVSILALLAWPLAVLPAAGWCAGLIAWRQIEARSTELTGRGFALAGMGLSMLFLVSGIARLSYIYVTELPEGYERISFDQLQPDARQPDELVPAAAQSLDGKRVFIKGYVYPTRFLNRIKTFVLVPDKGTCCFGGNPRLTDMIEVNLQGPLELKYTTDLRKVAGTFRVSAKKASLGFEGVVYHLDADHLE
jgi:hypothetical protein